ncbi:MAG: methionyl-tRNA formyltransferase [Candidatus Dasytiphilus stammeri]
MSNFLKIIFAGTSDFAATQVKFLISQHIVVGILTKPDRAVGRGQQVSYNPVKTIALQHKIALFQPDNSDITQEVLQKKLLELHADIMVVVAYGVKLPKKLLTIPRFGSINVHCSLLPRWRGASPIQTSILSGDLYTGVTIIQMNDKLDSGDILYQISCPICHTDTSATLLKKLSFLSTKSLLFTLHQVMNNTLSPKPQNHLLSTYAKKISKEEGYIDWTLSACEIERRIRAFNPWPGCYFIFQDKYIKVWQASIDNSYSCPDLSQFKPGQILHIGKKNIKIATNLGILNIEKLQLAGKKPMIVHEFLKSRKQLFRTGLIIE